MHMCFGNFRARAVGHRSYRPLFPHLGRARVISWPWRSPAGKWPRSNWPASLRPMGLAVGLVDVKNTWIEPPELVAERLRLVLKYIEPNASTSRPTAATRRRRGRWRVAKLASMVQGVRHGEEGVGEGDVRGRRSSGRRIISGCFVSGGALRDPSYLGNRFAVEDNISSNRNAWGKGGTRVG